MNGLNTRGYSSQEMALSGGVVRLQEVPLLLVKHKTHGAMSLTCDGEYLYLRFQRAASAEVAAKLTEMGWWYTDKGKSGRKAWFTDTAKNARAYEMLQWLNFPMEHVPNIKGNPRIERPKVTQGMTKPAPAHKGELVVELGHTSESDMVIDVATAPNGKVYRGVHLNAKSGRWMDADGKFVPKSVVPQEYQANGHTANAPAPAPTPVAVSPVASTGASVDKMALLKQALDQQAALIAAIQALG